MGAGHPTDLRGFRRGAALSEAAVLLCALAVVGTTGFVLVPRMVGAGGMSSPLPADIPPAQPAHVETFEAVRSTFIASREVLAVHTGDSGLTEIVLWTRDRDGDGLLDPDELIVLTHSAFLGTITVQQVAKAPGPLEDDFVKLMAPIERVWATHPEFSASWRKRTDVIGRTLAGGVDLLQLTPLPGSRSRPGFQVTLTWAAPETDDAIPDAVFGVPLALPSGQ